MSNLQQQTAATSFACFQLAKNTGLQLHELQQTSTVDREQAFRDIRSTYVRSFELVAPLMEDWMAQARDKHLLRVEAIEAGTCPTCAADKQGPPHFASSRCQSGGHNHCSCDTCF